MPIATHFQSATCRVVSLGPIAVMCLSGATTVTDLDHFDACHDLLSRSYKQLGTVTVMTGGFLKVSSRVIDRAAQMALKYKGITTDGVIVINGRGLMAVIARAVIATFAMSNRSGGIVKTFTCPLEGIQCANESLAKLGIPTLSPTEVGELVHSIVSLP